MNFQFRRLSLNSFCLVCNACFYFFCYILSYLFIFLTLLFLFSDYLSICWLLLAISWRYDYIVCRYQNCLRCLLLIFKIIMLSLSHLCITRLRTCRYCVKLFAIASNTFTRSASFDFITTIEFSFLWNTLYYYLTSSISIRIVYVKWAQLWIRVFSLNSRNFLDTWLKCRLKCSNSEGIIYLYLSLFY